MEQKFLEDSDKPIVDIIDKILDAVIYGLVTQVNDKEFENHVINKIGVKRAEDVLVGFNTAIKIVQSCRSELQNQFARS